MANVICGNSVYISTTGAASATGAKNVKIAYITFTGKLAADAVTLKDSDNSGATKITVKAAIADETVILDFSLRPLVFPNGVYVSALSANSTATLVFTTGGD